MVEFVELLERAWPGNTWFHNRG